MEDSGKTAGIVSYFSIIGWLIAYFGLYPANKTSLASYQLRQTLLLHIIALVLHYGVNIILGAMLFAGGGFFFLHNIIWIVDVGLLVLWIIGLIGAINGEQKPIPLIGERAQSMFAGI